jgi:hypothetical protein
MESSQDNNAAGGVSESQGFSKLLVELVEMILKVADPFAKRSCGGDFDFCTASRPCPMVRAMSLVSRHFRAIANNLLNTRPLINKDTVADVLQRANDFPGMPDV